MKLLILNGPNINLIGKRETAIYGNVSFETYLEQLKKQYPNIHIDVAQYDIEGCLIKAIQEADTLYDGIILNAGAYSHTSIGLADGIRAINIPVIEVHISNILARESYRKESFISTVCKGCIFGFGMESYRLAIESFCTPKN